MLSDLALVVAGALPAMAFGYALAQAVRRFQENRP